MEVGLAFGKVLRRRRVEAGFTQEQLAHESELQRNYVSLMERGINQPTITTLIKLANPLGCTAAEIVDEVERLVADQR
ncbi:helix-turn-helix domain-containing protein [Pseudomonas aeruginosa]